eukprot:23306-Chlamydomonas_euryale.AAC.1
MRPLGRPPGRWPAAKRGDRGRLLAAGGQPLLPLLELKCAEGAGVRRRSSTSRCQQTASRLARSMASTLDDGRALSARCAGVGGGRAGRRRRRRCCVGGLESTACQPGRAELPRGTVGGTLAGSSVSQARPGPMAKATRLPAKGAARI